MHLLSENLFTLLERVVDELLVALFNESKLNSILFLGYFNLIADLADLEIVLLVDYSASVVESMWRSKKHPRYITLLGRRLLKLKGGRRLGQGRRFS